MAEDELDKRAVDELLREASRARVRAETMGPAGWMKCPLHSTNKRFLLNTLRTSAQQRPPPGSPSGPRPSTRGRQGETELGSKSRGHSRTPPGDPRANGDGHRGDYGSHTDRGDGQRADEYDGYGERGRGRDGRGDRHGERYGHQNDSLPKTHRHRSEGLPPHEGDSSPRSRPLSGDGGQADRGSSSSSVSGHASYRRRERSRSPGRGAPSGRILK